MNNMNRVLAVLGLGLGLGLVGLQEAAAAGPIKETPRYGIVAGVNLDAVPWPEFCAAVQPVTVTRGGVTCDQVHPASAVAQVWQDVSGTMPNGPGLDCAKLKSELDEYRKDALGGCRVRFTQELRFRAGKSIKYSDMPFEKWRAKYFGKFIVQGVQK